MQAVSTRSFRHSFTSSSALYRSALAAAMIVSATAGTALANPTGGVVTGGGATINQTDPNRTIVNQTTHRAIIDWQTFNINNGQSTHFNQPGVNSVALNRIHDQNPSQIFGSLSATGKLVLVNPNGVFFGAGSRVDVSGLIATTADMSNSDFMRGSTHFNIAGRPDASIINKGTITAAEGGLVALVAPAVRNDGIIQAKSGAVRIGSSETFTVDFYGDNLYSFATGKKAIKAGKDENGNDMASAVENNGTIQGASVLLTANAAKDIVTQAVNNTGVIEARGAHMEGGSIVLDGGEGKVRVSGTLDASGTKGGKITVTGKAIALESAKVKATGDTAGGEVRIGGDYQGGGTLQHADTVWMDGDSTIDVSALDSGNGGLAVLWSDIETAFNGTLRANGGANGGDGGVIETSSKGILNFEGYGDASAAKDAAGNYLGKAGLWLLDPTNVTIGALQALGINLALIGTNVTIQTAAAGVQPGNITLNSAINSGGIGSLIMLAHNDIILNAAINLGLSLGSVTLTADSDNNGSGNIAFNNASINLGTGNVTLNAINVALNGNSQINTNLVGGITINNEGTFFSNTANSLNVGAASLTGIKLNQSTAGSIQNAINAVGTTGLPLVGGATLTLGAGVFDQYFNINQGNFTVNGQGQGVTIIRPSSLAGATGVDNGTPWAYQNYKSIILAGAPDSTLLTPVTVSNLTVDGSLVKNWDTAGLTFYNTFGVANNVTITNGGAFGLYSVADSTKGHAARTLLANNVISNGNLWAAAAVIGDNQTAHFLGGTYDGTGGNEALDLSNGSHGTITNVTMKTGTVGESAGIVFHGGHDWLITGGSITGAGAGTRGIVDAGLAYGVPAASKITILGTNMDNVGNGILANGGSEWTVLGGTYNAAAGNTGTGITFANMTGNNSITGVTLNDFNTGIRIDNTDGVKTTLNFINRAVTGIFANDSSLLEMTANIMTDISGDGIDLRGVSQSKFTGNVIGSVAGNSSVNSLTGVWGGSGITSTFFDGANYNGNTYTANVISGFNGTGIRINGVGNATLKTNIITNGTNPGAWGIALTNGANNNVVDSANIITGGNGIASIWASDNTIKNNVLLGITGDGVYVYGSKGPGWQTNVSVLGNLITAASGNTGNGIKFEDVWTANAGDGSAGGINVVTGFGKGISVIDSDVVSINNNLLLGNGVGVFVDPSTNISVIANNILGGDIGVWMKDSNGNFITGNNIGGTTGDGVFVDNSDNTTVDGNLILLVGGNGVNVVNSNDTIINGNTIAASLDGVTMNNSRRTQVYSNTIGGGVNGVSAYNNSHDLNVHDNTAIVGLAGDGVRIERSNRANVSNNTLIAGGHDGVRAFRSNDLTVDNNTIVAVNDGVSLERSNDASITGNTIGAGHDGVNALLSGSVLTVTGNGIIAGNTGVYARGMLGGQIDGNNILAIGGNGVDIANAGFIASGLFSVDGNTIVSLLGHGVAIDNAGLFSVNGNTIGALQDGVHIANSSLFSVNGNTIVAGNDGVWLNHVNGATILGNGIGAVHNGITLNDGDTTAIDGNGIIAGNNGIDVANSQDTLISNNDILAVLGDGVHVNNSFGNIVALNTIVAGVNGITFIDSDPLVIGNNILALTGDGIYSIGTNDLIAIGNNIISVLGNGINFINGNTLVVAGNTIAALQDGVKVDNALGVVVAGNTIIAGGDGVDVNNAGLVGILDNDILAITGDGVKLNNAYGTVTAGNTIVSLLGNGVLINGGLGHLVAGNTIAALNNGVDIRNTGLFGVYGNDILSGNDGIHVENAGLFQIAGNDILSVLGDGIDINGAALFRVNNNNIATLVGNGIEVSNAGLFRVDHNNVLGVVGNGIDIRNAGLFRVDHNNLITVVGDGIHVQNAGGFRIDNNNALTVVGDGIDIDNAGLFSVDNNNLITVVGNGIEISDAALFNVSGNDAITVVGDGINVRNAGLFNISGNRLFTLVGNGVSLENTWLGRVGGNLIVSLFGNGIEMDNANGTLIDGNLIAAGFDGINMDDSTGTAIVGNAILAGRDGIHATDSSLNVIALNAILGLRDGVNIHGGGGNLITLNAIGGLRDGVHIGNSTGNAIVLNAIGGGRDGIHLHNASLTGVGLNLIGAGRDGVHSNGGFGQIIAGNLVFAGRDGVHMNGVTGSLIALNDLNAGRDGINGNNLLGTAIIANDVSGSGRDGVNLRNSTGAFVALNQANNVGRDGFRNSNTRDAIYWENTANNNNRGFNIINGSDNVTLIGNTMTDNNIGARVSDSDDIAFIGNTFTNNNIGARILNTDGTTFTGDIFTGNNLGIELNNDSDDTVLKNLTITTAPGGTGIWIRGGSGNTRGEGLNISGVGGTGIHLSDAGSEFQFSDGGPGGNFSTFDDNLAWYFILDNGAMVGETLDASQQKFAGKFAFDFTVADLAAAEAKTIDDEARLIVGDVFYKFFPSFTVRNEEDRKRKGLFRGGLFSYAGRTLDNNIEENPVQFEVSKLGVDLSLLNRTLNNPTTSGGIANLFANLAPAAGGAGTGKTLAEQLASLKPSAGGPGTLGGAATGGCGNNFLDAGASLNFSIGACQ